MFGSGREHFAIGDLLMYRDVEQPTPHFVSVSAFNDLHLQTRKKMLKISFEGCTNVKWNGPSLYLSGSWMDG